VNTTKRFSPTRLRQARGEQRVEALAVAADVSTQTIRNWEAGQGEPDASKLAALAAFLRKPMGFFFEDAA
jgi:transcriptional regulator with XRE-family HTH domain